MNDMAVEIAAVCGVVLFVVFNVAKMLYKRTLTLYVPGSVTTTVLFPPWAI